MFNKKLYGILYLDRDSFTYYTENTTPLTFTYPTASIRELEIENEQLFIKEASAFIQSNKIKPTLITILLSPDILYEKDFTDESQTQQDKNEKHIKKEEYAKQEEQLKTGDAATQKNTSTVPEKNIPEPLLDQTGPAISPQEQHALQMEERKHQIQSFLDIVPFEDIASKSYRIDKVIKVIVTNKRLYEVIIHIFAKQMFIIDSVVPITALGKEVLPTQIMDQEAVKKIIRKFESVKQQSLLEENSYALSRAAIEPHGIQMTTKVTSKREYVLIAIFSCLLITLGVITYATFFSPAKDRKIASMSGQVTPTVLITPTEFPLPTETASPSAETRKELVKVLISGGTETQANLLRQNLSENGFIQISTRPNNIPASGNTLVIFSSQLSPVMKETFLQQLRQNVLRISAQEAASPEADIIVNL